VARDTTTSDQDETSVHLGRRYQPSAQAVRPTDTVDGIGGSPHLTKNAGDGVGWAEPANATTRWLDETHFGNVVVDDDPRTKPKPPTL